MVYFFSVSWSSLCSVSDIDLLTTWFVYLTELESSQAGGIDSALDDDIPRKSESIDFKSTPTDAPNSTELQEDVLVEDMSLDVSEQKDSITKTAVESTDKLPHLPVAVIEESQTDISATPVSQIELGSTLTSEIAEENMEISRGKSSDGCAKESGMHAECVAF